MPVTQRNPGNLTDDGETYKYVYNPFGQLVRITDVYDNPLAVYTYNGLGQRISEQLDVNDAYDSGMPDGIADGYDPVFYLAIDQHGRRVATYRGEDDHPKETFVWHPANLGGPALRAGSLLLRDRDDLLEDPTQWALDEPDGTRDQRHYFCHDFRGDIAAVLNLGGNGGELVEQVRYTANGIPFNIPIGDLFGSGTVVYDADIYDALMAEYDGLDGSSDGYHAIGDFNLDGYNDGGDLVVMLLQDSVTTGRGKLSGPAVGSRVGYKQMEAFGEGFGLLWSGSFTVRNAGFESILWWGNRGRTPPGLDPSPNPSDPPSPGNTPNPPPSPIWDIPITKPTSPIPPGIPPIIGDDCLGGCLRPHGTSACSWTFSTTFPATCRTAIDVDWQQIIAAIGNPCAVPPVGPPEGCQIGCDCVISQDSRIAPNPRPRTTSQTIQLAGAGACMLTITVTIQTQETMVEGRCQKNPLIIPGPGGAG